jgi:hypothetical protein
MLDRRTIYGKNDASVQGYGHTDECAMLDGAWQPGDATPAAPLPNRRQ